MQSSIALDFVPESDAEFLQCLADPMWRVCSGRLYKIMVKDGDGEGVVPFIPNRAQRRLISKLWHRNIILKARQLGFTTLVAILWLDHALFNADQRCGIIAQDREAAEAIFRDKVKLAYNNLPDQLRERFPLGRDSATELLFAHNNSSVRVATSMRSGTIHRLHISEFGKICAKFPDKAKEVVTGSLPAVPLDGIAIIESTAEGQEGSFYAMTQRAQALADSGSELNERDYRFHFFPWWQEDKYRITGTVITSESDNQYFDKVEGETGQVIDREQRNWYIATRDADFGGDPEKMWQEYPSTAKEAFQVSTEGTYYANQIAAARKEKRITTVPVVDGIPVNTFWDIGSGDGTAVWFHQQVGLRHRFVKFIEGWNEPYSYFTKQMQATGFLWGTHYLPHDAEHKRQQGEKVAAPIDELRASGVGGMWETVPRVDEVIHGIQLVRSIFNQCEIDESGCKEGVEHLANYKKTWSRMLGRWTDTPRHDEHSESADAFRQFAQAEKAGMLNVRTRAKRAPREAPNWRAA